jgi:hypothetical protein
VSGLLVGVTLIQFARSLTNMARVEGEDAAAVNISQSPESYEILANIQGIIEAMSIPFV